MDKQEAYNVISELESQLAKVKAQRDAALRLIDRSVNVLTEFGQITDQSRVGWILQDIDKFTKSIVEARKPHPMDKNYLREMAKVVESKLPDQHGFIVFAFPLEGGRMFYLANGERKDCINALKEWLIQAGGEEEWMKHLP